MRRRKLRISIRDDAKDFVDDIASEDGITGPDVVRKALQAYRYLRRVKTQDGEVILRRADNSYERFTNI